MAVDLATYPSAPAHGFAGQLAHPVEGSRVFSGVALAALLFGVPVLADRTNGTTQGLEQLAAPDAADVDGIVAALATAATAQSVTGAGLDGAIGAAELWPPRNITMTLSSHADYNLTTAYVRGLDENGLPQEEAFVIPDAGNATLTGNKFFSFVTEVYIPAQGGTGGSTQVGFGSKLGPIDKYFRGVSVYDNTIEPGGYAEDDEVPVCEEGVIYVQSETAVDPTKPVYVRLVIAGAEVRGAFRATVDSTDLALLKRARWVEKTTGAGIAGLRLLPR